MNLRQSLLDLLSSTKGVDASNLTQNQQYNIELLEQRIMYSATQAGAALGGEAGLNADQFENLCCDSGVQELFGRFDECIDQGEIENFVNDMFGDTEQSGNDVDFSQDVFFGDPPTAEAAELDTHGTSGDDVLDGDTAADTLTGGDGNDQVSGLDGSDDINGNAGNDQVFGGAGDDIARGGTGDDFVAGNEGNDAASGGEGDDEVRGNDGDDLVQGNAGNDVLYGNDGNDTIEGGDGNDRLIGGAGDDILDGGRGHDVAFFNNSFEQFSFELVDGNLEVTGTSGTDIVMQNVEMLEFTDRTVEVQELVAARADQAMEAPVVEAPAPVVDAPAPVEAPSTPMTPAPEVVEAPVEPVAQTDTDSSREERREAREERREAREARREARMEARAAAEALAMTEDAEPDPEPVVEEPAPTPELEPASEPENIYSYDVIEPAGGSRAGDIQRVTTSFNEATNELAFKLTIDGNSEGFTLAINDGPNPKGHADELALLYFDNSGPEPVISAYNYDGKNNLNSFQNEQLVSSLGPDSPFSNISVTTDADGVSVFSFELDATSIQEYSDNPDWTGVSFQDDIGVWLHPVNGLETTYDSNGFLETWNFNNRSFFDVANQEAELLETQQA